MAESLALKYRPRTFQDIVGQKSVQVILSQMVLKERVPSGLLFDGSRGCGKTSSARILAAALNCEEIQPGPCTHCPSCKSVFDGTSLDVLEVDAASHGLVSDIRELVNQVMYSVSGRSRVVLLDEAHSMSREAFNALLKTLEEPPMSTVFILLTTEPGRIPDTILSRLMSFTFKRISVGDIVSRLEYICAREHIEADKGLLLEIAERADGGMRDAVKTLDQVTAVGVRTAEQFAELIGEVDFAPQLIEHLRQGAVHEALLSVEEQMFRLGDPQAISSAIITTFRDLVVLKAGGAIPKQGAALESRKALASRLEATALAASLRVLWEFKTKIRLGEDLRVALDLSVVMLAETLRPARAAAAPSQPTRRLSLAEMRSLT